MDGFGANDTRAPDKPKKKYITEGDIVWFGKHRGKPSEAVDPGYWRWAAENLDWLEVDPELYEGKIRVIGPDDLVGFGRYADRPGALVPLDYILWADENLEDVKFCEELIEKAEEARDSGELKDTRPRHKKDAWRDEPDTRYGDEDEPPF